MMNRWEYDAWDAEGVEPLSSAQVENLVDHFEGIVSDLYETGDAFTLHDSVLEIAHILGVSFDYELANLKAFRNGK